jgi:hypothetical protein
LGKIRPGIYLPVFNLQKQNFGKFLCGMKRISDLCDSGDKRPAGIRLQFRHVASMSRESRQHGELETGTPRLIRPKNLFGPGNQRRFYCSGDKMLAEQ